MAIKNPRAQDPRDARHWEAVEEAAELATEGRLEESLAELKAVLGRDANNPYAYNLLGTVLWEVKQLEPARDAFKAAVLLSPDFLGARLGLSHALRRLGNAAEAERQARLAVTRFPDDGEAYHALGMALAAQGERREAIQCLERFLDSKPEFEASSQVRGVIEMLRAGNENDPFEEEDDD